MTQQHYFAIIGEWFHMGNCTSANVFFCCRQTYHFWTPRCQCYKTYFLRNSWWVKIKLLSFVPGKHCKPGPKFVVKARSLRWRGAPERWSTWVGSLLIRQYKIRLKNWKCLPETNTQAVSASLSLTKKNVFIIANHGIKFFLFIPDKNKLVMFFQLSLIITGKSTFWPFLQILEDAKKAL